MDLAVGQVYGEKYKIVRLLGQGSMGAVYEGENIRIHRKVAIKTLHHGMAEKGDTLQRFEREAQAAGRIGSKHICEVLDMGDLPDGSRFMVMEHLEGITLQQHIRARGRLKPIEASPILQQLLEGLGAAHAAGIIHRDLKPANVFLVRHPGRPDFVKILDFGVSKFSVLAEEMSMTRTGAVLGTPYYMSPEQAKGSRGTDARSDLYAVGVILYECITGQVPFSAETFNELLFRIVLESPPPAESFVPDLPPEMAAIIRKSMAREPADRYQSADELKHALAEWSARAEAVAASDFDGLATMDAQTVMRTSPFAAPALRPPPPSTTASGVMVMDGAAAAPQAVAGLGTVIIDPAVVPGQAQPPGVPNVRDSLPTIPLPQWGSSGAPQVASSAPAPAIGADGAYGPPFANRQEAGQVAFYEGAPQQPHPLSRRAMRSIAFVGVAIGLLVGLATWAFLWGNRDNEAVPGPAAATAPSPPIAPSAAPSAPPSEPTPTAAPSSVMTAAEASAAPNEPSPPPTVAEPTAAPEPPPVRSPARASATGTKTVTGSAAATASAKPTGGKNPSGGRTVSQDL